MKSEIRNPKSEISWIWLGAVAAVVVAVFAGGCMESAADSRAQQGDALLRDPMNYKSTPEDFPDVGGGGIGNLDKKGFKRDLDSVFNP